MKTSFVLRPLACAALIFSGTSIAAGPGPGELDGSGFDITADAGGSKEAPRDVVIPSSGNVYVLNKLSNSSYALQRFTAAGAVDATFGTGGRIAFGASSFPVEEYFALAIDETSGFALVAGAYDDFGATGAQFLVRKLKFSDGTFDTTFGVGGSTRLDTADDGSVARMLIDGSGRIVLAGVTGTINISTRTIDNAHPLIARLTTAGVADPAFTPTAINWGSAAEAPSGVSLDASQRIVLTGVTGLSPDFGFGVGSSLARLLANGGLDHKFGTNGIFAQDFEPGTCAGNASGDVCEGAGLLYPQAGGKFLVTVYIRRDDGGNDTIQLTRFLPGGALDETFGPNGSQRFPAADSLRSSLPAVQADGRIVLAKDLVVAPPGTGEDTRVYRILGYTATGINHPPFARPNAKTLDEDTHAPTLIKVLGNDGDADGDPLTITGVTAAAHGTSVVGASGMGVRYTPAHNFQGTDSFDYTVSDGRGGTAVSTVTLTVVNVDNDPPIANPDAIAVAVDAGFTDVPVLANDTDPDPNPTLSVVKIWKQPAHGSARVLGGTVQYQPAAGFAGADTFTYRLSDGTLMVNGIVTVTVGGP